jgi:ABC-type glycerol-3-phosphate transport system substrate-binding protein
MRKARLAISAAAAALILAACGGGSNSVADTAESQMQRDDRAASMSIAGLIEFGKAQIASFTSDSAEPRVISGIAPMTSDTDEPQPIN